VYDPADDPAIVRPLNASHIRWQMRLNAFPLFIAQPKKGSCA